MNAFRWSIAVFLVTGVCVAQEQSLGDFARQQKADRARAKAARVITDENLPKAQPWELANGAVVTGKAAADNTAAEKPAAAAKSASAAPAAPDDVQKRIETLKATEEAQQRAVKKFEEELKDDSISAERRQLFEDGLRNARQLLDESTQERERVERAAGMNTEAADTESAKPAETKAPQDAPADKSSEAKTEKGD